MTSTLNDDSLTKMDRVGKEQVIEMFKRGFTYQQVTDELKQRYPGKRGFSVPSIKGFCSKNGISSRISNHFVSYFYSCKRVRLNVELFSKASDSFVYYFENFPFKFSHF